jgi:hypothetical protein
LDLASLPPTTSLTAILDWADYFEEANRHWVLERKGLYAQLTQVCRKNWKELKALEGANPVTERRVQARIRFATNKLAVLGYSGVSDVLFEILGENPSTVREPLHLIAELARQGFADEIVKLLSHYETSDKPMSDYMRAAILRALRFLPRFEQNLWEILFEYAISGSDVERLMATESWLFLSRILTPVDQERYMEIFKEILCNPSLTSRLKKNYLLIVGQYNPGAIDKFGIEGAMGNTVQDLVSRESVERLFAREEPGVIRKAYYSGKYRISEESYEPYY